MRIPSKEFLLNKETLARVIQELCKRIDKQAAAIPTKLSDLTNDVGFVTQDDIVTGDVIVVANQEMPEEWTNTNNMSELINIINEDSRAIKGTVFLSTISLSDLPSGMIQAELKAEVLLTSEMGKIILFTITSNNTAPYHWEYTSAWGGTSVWRAFQVN